MSFCAIANSIDYSCAKKRLVGGNAQKVWLVSSMEAFGYTEALGYITTLSFDTGEGLVSIEGAKNSHSAGSALVVTENKNTYHQHDVVLKTIAQNPTEIGAIEALASWEGPIIVETYNRQFYIYGLTRGMKQTVGVQNTGVAAANDISNIITFVGEEPNMPKLFFVTDYAATLALLESYEI